MLSFSKYCSIIIILSKCEVFTFPARVYETKQRYRTRINIHGAVCSMGCVRKYISMPFCALYTDSKSSFLTHERLIHEGFFWRKPSCYPTQKNLLTERLLPMMLMTFWCWWIFVFEYTCININMMMRVKKCFIYHRWSGIHHP